MFHTGAGKIVAPEGQGNRIAALLARIGLIGAISAVITGSVGPPQAGAERERIPGPIAARVISVVDGDTLRVRARIWLGQEVETAVRLDGVDAPELRGACPRERELARRARDYLKVRLTLGQVILRDIRFGKYAGRVVARVSAPDGTDLSAMLIAAALGQSYNGRRRATWCALE